MENLSTAQMETLANMVVSKLQNKPSEATQAPVSAPTSNNVPVVITPAPVALEATTEAKDDAVEAEVVTHIPALDEERMIELLNDARIEVRSQTKYPLVVALEEMFANPAATAVINGKKQPLISADQMATAIDALKKSGKYWPQPVVTFLNQKGEKVFANFRYKNEDGGKWILGSVVKAISKAVKGKK